MALGDGLPCGFAYAKSSRTSLRAVEPDVSTPRHFMPYTACAVISSPPLQKKAPRLRCIVFEMVVGDGLPCGFACAKSSRTSLRAVEPDVSTPRHFMPYTACAVISSPHCKKKHPVRGALFLKWWWEMDSNHRKLC